MSILYKVPRAAKRFGLKGYMPLLHTRGPETFTSLDVGSCFIINASDVFILTSQASKGIYYVTTDHATPPYTYFAV